MEAIGQYRVLRELGKGATATVYLCQAPDRPEPVAVKLVRFGDNPALARRLKKLFQTEMLVARRLEHPNIVQIYDAVVEDECAYLVMEYVEGFSLENHIRIDRLLPEHRVISIIFKCALALDHAYRQGVIHRDIKPANILIAANDEPKIADFGLALNLHKDKDRDSTFIMGLGSPAYMSPEQVKSYPLNQQTDLYSLAVVLFQLLTGRMPFRAGNAATLIYKIVNADAPKITDLNPNLAEGLNAVLKKGLEKDLYNRFKTGAEFGKELAAVRYRILDDNEVEQDSRMFEQLRRLDFFTEFENVEIWEILRVSSWRQLPAGVPIVREGESNRVFGLLVSGFVEVSVEGRALCRLGVGEVIGEVAYLHPSDQTRQATVLTLEPTLFFEINAAALDLASEELRERMQKALTAKLIERLRAVNRLAAAYGAPAVQPGISAQSPVQSGEGIDLELAPL